MNESSSENLCACGCGETTSIATRTSGGRIKGKPNRYVKGHNTSQRALRKVCQVEGCDKPVDARGWCRAHYNRWRTTGDDPATSPLRPRGNVNTGLCKVEGCERQAKSRGWCTAHYERWSRYGDPEAGGPLREAKKITTRKVCAWPEGCTNLEKARGFCAKHWGSVRHSPKYELLLPPEFRAERCIVPHCENPQYANAFCRSHYGQAQRGNDPIAKLDTPPVRYETFGGRLFALRASRGWSLLELGDRIGLSRERIRQLEKRRNPPRPDTIGKLAKAFGVEASALIADQVPAYVGSQDSKRKPGRPEKPRAEHLHIHCLWCKGSGYLSLAGLNGNSLETVCAYCQGSGAIYISTAPPLSDEQQERPGAEVALDA